MTGSILQSYIDGYTPSDFIITDAQVAFFIEAFWHTFTTLFIYSVYLIPLFILCIVIAAPFVWVIKALFFPKI